MKSLSIYILCHNRPDDARQAILSALRQTDQEYSLTVSDNSSNDEVNQLVRNEFPDIKYICRAPSLEPLEHFNRCLDEVPDGYLCLFHDDDLMEPNFVSEMKRAIQGNPDAIAIACNANIERFGKVQERPSFLSFRHYEAIASPCDMAMRYFSRFQSGIAPFPSYIYHRGMIDSQRFALNGGKYSDVTWLLELVKKGRVVWVNSPLITYRLHASNDGNTESRRDRLRFLGYLKKNRYMIGDGILQDYRYGFLYKALLKAGENMHLKRLELARLFVNKYRWLRYTRIEMYKSLLMRAIIKWMAIK